MDTVMKNDDNFQKRPESTGHSVASSVKSFGQIIEQKENPFNKKRNVTYMDSQINTGPVDKNLYAPKLVSI